MQNSTGGEKTTEEDIDNKKTKNLYNALVKDQESIFYLSIAQTELQTIY